MRSTELHGERRGWNLHLVGRVVYFWWIFLEVRIFRNVRDQFQNLVTHKISAAAAIREDGVLHQDHAGARLVLMAYFIDPRLLDQLSRSQSAIALIICCEVRVLQFHSDACFCFLPLRSTPSAQEQLGQSTMGCVQGSHKLERSGFREKLLLVSFEATPTRARKQQLCLNCELPGGPA